NLRYPGQYHDRETGLYNNRFRYYEPTLGRFLSPDPLGAVAGLNEYLYAANPVNWIDPLGLEEEGCTLELIEPKIKDDPPLPVAKFRLELRDGKWVTVSASGMVRSAKGLFVFVTKGGRILVTNPNQLVGDGDRTVFHTDLGNGNPVHYAGEIRFSNKG